MATAPQHKPASAVTARGPAVRISTLQEVAREAGVSAASVSRFLNGTARVADTKRKAIESAIKRLGFLPNPAAQSLKMGRTMTVGMLTQDVESPYFARMMRGVEDGLAGSGYALVIASGRWDAVDEAARARLLMARRIDGLVVLAGHLSNDQVLELARRQPVVVAGRQLQGDGLRAVALDQRRIGHMATRHLLGLGHRRVAHLQGPPERQDAIDRRAGYHQALTEAGLTPAPALEMVGDFQESGGLLAMDRLLDANVPFSAVFAANDQMAYGARMALYRRGIRVPDDISLIGVDDLPASAYATPPLTTVRQPLYEIGAFVAAELLQLMGHDIEIQPMPVAELVLRETTRRT